MSGGRSDRRSHWVAGLSPANVITLAVLAATGIGSIYVMHDDIGDLEKANTDLKQQIQQQNAAMWQRISECR